MIAWEIFWAIIILFSTLSFTFMSVKILHIGFSELKEMFKKLESEM